jgi:hypothetical protein
VCANDRHHSRIAAPTALRGRQVYLALSQLGAFTLAIDAAWVGQIADATNWTYTADLHTLDVAHYFGAPVPDRVVRRAIRLRVPPASAATADRAAHTVLLLGPEIQVLQVSLATIQPLPELLRDMPGCADILGLVTLPDGFSFLVDVDRLLKGSA